MGRLKNSVLANSVNRKALTFDAEIVSNIANTNLEKKPGDIIVEQIDAQGLESEISSAEKFAALMRAIGCLKCDLEERIAELTYEVVCHGYDFDGNQFTVPEAETVVIPFELIMYTPSDGTYLQGEFTAGRTGYYDVHVYFENDSLIAPAGENIYLHIGGSHDESICDGIIINTDTTQLQGSRVVYCRAGQNIYSALSHTYAGNITFNSLAYPGAGGYISISYAGGIRSATNL